MQEQSADSSGCPIPSSVAMDSAAINSARCTPESRARERIPLPAVSDVTPWPTLPSCYVYHREAISHPQLPQHVVDQSGRRRPCQSLARNAQRRRRDGHPSGQVLQHTGALHSCSRRILVYVTRSLVAYCPTARLEVAVGHLLGIAVLRYILKVESIRLGDVYDRIA